MALLNIAQLVGRLQMLVNEQIDYEEAKMILDDEYRALWTGNVWSFAKTETRLTTTTAKTAGTIAVTQGSAVVTGTNTGFALTDVGAFIQLPDGRYYEIGTVDDVLQTLILGKPSAPTVYVGADSADELYTIFYNRYTLDTDVESIIVMSASAWTLLEGRQRTFDDLDPQRIVTGEPTDYAYIDPDPTTGTTRIEFWPVPIVAYSLPYVGLKRGALTGAATSQLVQDLSEGLLHLAAATACNMILLKTGEDRWDRGKDFYQRKGDTRILEARKNDRRRFGKDDIIARSQLRRYMGATNIDLGPGAGW